MTVFFLTRQAIIQPRKGSPDPVVTSIPGGEINKKAMGDEIYENWNGEKARYVNRHKKSIIIIIIV